MKTNLIRYAAVATMAASLLVPALASANNGQQYHGCNGINQTGNAYGSNGWNAQQSSAVTTCW